MPQINQRKAIHADGLLLRQAILTREAVNMAQRTVTLSVSSENPVERWFGREILDHNKKCVRTERILSGGPVLKDHDQEDLIGVVESFELRDGKAFATLRFSSSADATQILQDINDGIRRNVSIGYVVHQMQLEQSGDNGDVYRALDWEPYEISIVSIPADITVGVGRSAQFAHDILIKEVRKMDDDLKDGGQQPTATPAATPSIDRAQVQAEVRNTELKRIRDLEALGEKFSHYDGRAIAQQFIRDGRSIEEFRDAIFAKLPQLDKAGSGEKPVGSLDLSRSDKQRYSLIRAINASISGDWSKAGFEKECSMAVTDKLQRESRGFYIPYDVLGQKRVMTTAGASGGLIVPTDYMPDEFIDRLRDATIIAGLGARYLTGLKGNVDIPGLNSGATFYWLAEDASVTDSDAGLRHVTLTPKTVAGSVAMSRRLLIQSAPSIDALVENDLRLGMALAIDTAAINGTGAANQPTGLLTQAGVLTQAIAVAGSPTRSELRKFKTAMKKANSYLGNPSFITTPDIEGYLEDTQLDAGSGRFLLENGKCVGVNVLSTNLMPANKILFGNYADLLIGFWGTLDVMTDTSTKAASGGVVLRIFQEADIGIRRPQSFVKSA